MARSIGNQSARGRFLETVRVADHEIDLAEACFWISAEANPDLEVAPYRAKLDELAEGLRLGWNESASVVERVQCLNHYLFEEHKFHGNDQEYYDPRNSYLDAVLDRRTGIPITLSILWMSIADRLGIPSYGVGFPGHFLVGVESNPPIYVDAFSAVVMTAEDCQARLREIAGGDVKFDSAMLAPTSRGQILARVLRNLKQIHATASEYAEAIACIDRILLLEPDQPTELRDRGVLHRSLECWSSAREDLERFIALSPEAPEVENVKLVLEELRVRTAQIH